MTLPPYDRPHVDPTGSPAPGWGYPPQPPAGARRSRRGVAVAATVAGVLVLGGGGFAVASFLADGSQPEDVLPGDTLGFVRIDLDPSLGQKMALMSLLEHFPEVDTETDGDLRGELMQPLLELSETQLDYENDVQPWLGDRMAVAAVPAEGTEEGAVPVVVLAVTDVQRMTEALTTAGGEFGFAVRDDYVLITDTQERADDLAAAEESLADDADFAGDLEALGDDQIALAWADLSSLERLIAVQGGMQPPPGELFGAQDLTGRVILGVHATDDALELVALDFSVSDTGAPSSEPTRLVQNLPEDTLAALSLGGVGDRAVEGWEQLEASGGLQDLEDPAADLGLDLPDDLRTILGTDLAVAVFGDLENPVVGGRVATDQSEEATLLLDTVLSSPDVGVAAVYELVDGGYVVATDQATLDAMAADGGLGDTAAFRAAVADPDDASAIGYVDLAALIDQVIAQGGPDAEEAAQYSAVEALGFSASSTDEGGRFVLRITVR